jgi:hypothetical protein
MFAKHRPIECRKKPKPVKPGAPPTQGADRGKIKEHLQQKSIPFTSLNQKRQHYTRTQRG